MKKHTQRGFTLMELMVVIVIVAILAAVAVPLYINYVKDAQRTEAKGAIGAIVNGEQAYYQKSGAGLIPSTLDLTPGAHYSNSLDKMSQVGVVDMTEAQANWSFVLTSTSSSTDPTKDGFTVVATNKKDPKIQVEYDFTRGGGGNFIDNPTSSGTGTGTGSTG